MQMRYKNTIFSLIFFVSFSSLYASVNIRVVLNSGENDTAKLERLFVYISNNYFSKLGSVESKSDSAFELAEKLKDTVRLSELHRMMGIVRYFNGEYKNALTHYYASLELCRKIKSPRGQAMAFLEVANLYKKITQLSDSREAFDSALYYARAAKDTASIASVYNGYGIIYEIELNYKAAHESYQVARRLYESRRDTVGLSYSMENIGGLYLLENKFDSSEKYLLIALKLREGMRRGKEPDQPVAYSYSYLGQLYYKQGNYSSALIMYNKAADIGVRIRYPDLLQNIYYATADVYKAMKDFKSAYDYFQKATAIRDSLFTTDKSNQILELQTRFDVENQKKANQILQQQKELAQKESRTKTLVIWFITIIVAGIVATVVMYLRRRQMREHEKTRERIRAAEERQRILISQELHDNVGAQLSYVVSNLEATQRELVARREPDLKRISAISEMSKMAINTLRETVWALNNKSISAEAFFDKYKDYALKICEFNEHVHVEFEEDFTIDYTLQPNTALNLFRICQEAFSNAVRHSGADVIAVSMKTGEGKIAIEIRDNGKGFDTSAHKDGHFGMENMALRAAEINAGFELESSEGKGTSVRIIMDYHKNNTFE